jgi:hypothetical protein
MRESSKVLAMKKEISEKDPKKMTYGELLFAQKELGLFKGFVLPEKMNKPTATFYYNEKIKNCF